MTTLFISHSSKDKAWAKEIRERLHDQGYKSLFLDSHPDDGIHAGADWEQTLWRYLRQSRGLIVLCTPNWLGSPWCLAEAMMARERGKRVFLLATAEIGDGRQVKGAQQGEDAPRVPDFLKDTQFISLAEVALDEAYGRLWTGLAKEGLKDEFPLPDRPYPGLKPFQESDAAVYFGRNDVIAHIREILERRRGGNAKGFILILGASGCGKSSLVRAGVLPRLRPLARAADAPCDWVIACPFVGRDGLDGLTRSLSFAFDGVGRPKALDSWLLEIGAATDTDSGARAAGRSLQDLANDLLVAHRSPEGKLLLVLDQLEEVFGTAEGSRARALLRLLLTAAAAEGSSAVVLATMRSDFLNEFQLFPDAAEHYEEVTLDPMPKARFGEIIEGPADRFGLALDAGLPERLAEDTQYADALPLLAFTLEQLYLRRKEKGALRLQDYVTLFPAVPVRAADGSLPTERGVSAAIKHVADGILEEFRYDGLKADDPRLVDLRRAFFSLAQVGEAGQFTRRTALWSQVPSSCQAVLERFVSQRLLVSGAEHGERTLSVAHEALFRVWDTLHGWLLKDRKALTLRSQIEEAAAAWHGEQRTEIRAQLLWPEGRILDAISEIRRSGVSLEDVANPEVVRAFVGPTEVEKLAELPALGADQDAKEGSGRYGDAWRLPLGHEARASVGVRLALLGDPRLGVSLRKDGLPDIDWRRIGGGKVTIEIRANPDDPNSKVANTLRRTVEPFWIARYPVTIVQYQAFLQACHRDGEWRLPPGLSFTLPADYPPPKHRARHGNHPADSLNWWDAMAFCHWLSSCLGYQVRLPTEFEWQLAATGGDPKKVYPWGPDWDPQRANTLESELNRSTAVGLYPLGAAHAGVLDLAGNLWEWCLNDFNDPDDTGFPGAESLRALRGGSWHYNPDFARSAYRLRLNPDDRYDDFGFRVLCFSPIR